MTLRLKSGGHRAYFEPSAVIDHLNVTQLGALAPRALPGRPPDRRTARAAMARVDAASLYCGSPLIPVVILRRISRGVRLTRRLTRLPFGTLPALIIGAMVSAMGEMVGYVRGSERERRSR